MPRIKVMLLVVLVATTTLTGCFSAEAGPAGETTCREWLALQLPIEEQLFTGKRSKEQEDIVKRMLDARGLDTGMGNDSTAYTAIMQFCGIGSSIVRENSDRPIDDALEDVVVVDW